VKCFRFIAVEKATFPISLMCRVLGVSRSGFHAWQSRAPSQRDLQDAWLTEQIREIHRRSRATYGSPRIRAELRFQGVRVSRKRVERLMRDARLSGLVARKRGRTTIRVPGIETAPDLVERNFSPQRPNQLWTADITYIRTWQGFLYLASVVDCYSRKIVGWAIEDHLRASIVVEALEMALSRRRAGPGLVHHSDQGSQYTALVFSRRCRQAGIDVSMGSKGDCFDNAVCESFHATIKKELLYRRSWPTKQEARTAVFEWIEVFYNRERRHSTLGYYSPAEYERISIEKEQQAI
jgi:putative transposase